MQWGISFDLIKSIKIRFLRLQAKISSNDTPVIDVPLTEKEFLSKETDRAKSEE